MSEKFLNLIRAFNDQGVDYALIGGFAMIVYGYNRYASDAEIFVRGGEENISKLRAALKKLYDDEAIDEITGEEIRDYQVVRYGAKDGFSIDIIEKLGEKSIDDLEIRKEIFSGIEVRIASPETIYELKKVTGRPIDESDLLYLKEMIRKKNAGL